MLKYVIDRNNELVRRAMLEHAYSKVELENTIYDSAVAYFDRTGDHDALRDALKDRFAVGITKTTSLSDAGSDSETGYETYRKNAKEAQIDQGIIEAVTSGIGGKIVGALANMFTMQNQAWTYTAEDGDIAEDAEEVISEHRTAGGFSTALVDADSLSCAINGAYLYVSWKGGHLQYHVVNPTCFYAIYHEDIIDDGEVRAVDYNQIEDATAIVLRLSGPLTAAPDKQQYLAIFGRSEVYPLGRHVTYRASRWDNIPSVGGGGVDYVVPDGAPGAGGVANPLSWLAEQDAGISVPEYPIIALTGGLAKTGQGILTLTTSLFDNCVEIDIGYSRLLKDALNAARGKDVISNESGAPLPRSLEGVIALHTGQKLDIKGLPASNAQAAMEVLESTVVSVGSGYHVPDYMLISDQSSLSSASGVALMIRTSGLINFRNYRIQANAPQITRLFNIERGLIMAHRPEQGELLVGVRQSWDPGMYAVPEDKLIKTQRLDAALKSGFIDYVKAVRDFHNLATDAEAINLIEKMGENQKEYPAPAQTPKRGASPVGLTRVPQ